MNDDYFLLANSGNSVLYSDSTCYAGAAGQKGKRGKDNEAYQGLFQNRQTQFTSVGKGSI